MTTENRSKRSHHADVMVSSTSLDLPDHRKAVIDWIWRRRMFPLAMEAGTATTQDAIDFSLKLVNDAEIYVGVFANRYGHIPDDPVKNPDRLSVTELEYRRAIERNIPILGFVMDEKHPALPNQTLKDIQAAQETDPEKIAKLAALKKHVQAKVVGYFMSPEDLGAKVYQSLTELHESGAIQYDDEGDSSTPDADTGIPKPPKPYIAHPYILTRDFFGRKDELAQLDAWAANPNMTTLLVESIGGMGKSALTWEWVGRNAERFDAVMWWSFYDSDSAVSNFTRHALAYLTGKPLKDFNDTSEVDRARQLYQLLKSKRVLLVLDGIERILVAYHRIDAPQVADEQIKNADEQRRFTHPDHADLFRQLTQCAPSKLLISTRLIPADLEDKSRKLIRGVQHLHLNGLQPDDALALMRHLGITGDGRAIQQFTSKFGNHSLLIHVLAGRINEYRRRAGDFDRWYEDEGRDLKLDDLDISQKRTHILAYALQGLNDKQFHILGQIAAFRYPVDGQTLEALNPYHPPRLVEPSEPNEVWVGAWEWSLEKAETEEDKQTCQSQLDAAKQDLQAEQKVYLATKAAYDADLKTYLAAVKKARIVLYTALDDLEGRGLLQWDRPSDSYDLHPVVRGVAFERTPDDLRKQHFTAIHDHFEQFPPEDAGQVKDVHDLRRSMEVYTALVGAGLLDQALDFYRGRLSHVLYYQLASYPTIVELLTPLFPDPKADALPLLSASHDQSYAMSLLGGAFNGLGQTEQSLVLVGLTFKVDLDEHDSQSLAVGLSNYGSSLQDDNQLARALGVYQLGQALAEAIQDWDHIAMANLRRLGLSASIGDEATAQIAYHPFMDAPPQDQTLLWQASAERARATLNLAHGQDPSEALAACERFALAGNDGMELRAIANLRGEYALQRGAPAEAITHFTQAMERANKSGANTSSYSASLANAHALLGNRDEALRLLGEAYDIPEDAKSVFVAETYLALGEHDKAKTVALAAYKRAWADGLPYVRLWDLERAKKVLDAVGEPYPDMPPFDPSKIKPIPYEAEIRAFIEELKAGKKKT